MACDPQTLINDARCFECFGMGRMFDAMEVVLLCAIVDGESMACDPQTLLSQANCLLCTIPDGMWEPIKVSLLCQIATGGGGGSGAIQVYEGRDPAPPDDPTKAAVSYPVGGGALTQWDGAAWV